MDLSAAQTITASLLNISTDPAKIANLSDETRQEMITAITNLISAIQKISVVTPLERVLADALALKDLTEEEMTSEVLTAALSANGLALEFVPSKLQTVEVVKTALKQNKESHKFIQFYINPEWDEERQTAERAVAEKFQLVLKTLMENDLERKTTAPAPTEIVVASQ